MRELKLPEGKKKIFTLSYDDEVMQDRRFVEIINKYGLKCTFNINSGTFGLPGKVEWDGFTAEHNKITAHEAKILYKGHEISTHTVNHPDLTKLSREEIIKEVKDDMKALTELAGYEVNGMAYPYGTYNDEIVEILRECGIKYCRTVNQTKEFSLPEDFLVWHPSAHYGEEHVMPMLDEFLASDEPLLFYVWGHSYELDFEDTWDEFEEFCKKVSGHDDVWYATNGEIVRCQIS